MFSNQMAISYPAGQVKVAETILQGILLDKSGYLSDMMKQECHSHICSVALQ